METAFSPEVRLIALVLAWVVKYTSHRIILKRLNDKGLPTIMPWQPLGASRLHLATTL
jgi:hypothetical protein